MLFGTPLRASFDPLSSKAGPPVTLGFLTVSPAPDTRTHSGGLKAAGSGAAESANPPSPLAPISPNRPRPPAGTSRFSAHGRPRTALPRSCWKAAWPRHNGRDQGQAGGRQGGPWSAICSCAPSTVGCREAREPAARTPARAAGLAVPPPHPDASRAGATPAPPVGLQTRTGEGGRAAPHRL